MDLDPMKRRLVTRLIAALDTCLGLCVFIVQLYRMWDFYYRNERSTSNKNPPSPQLLLFITISFIVLSTKILQISMGFGLLVATFGRNLDASIKISTWWLRTSVFLLVTLILKLFFTATHIIQPLSQLLGYAPLDLIISLFGILFRLFATFWVTRFIIFLQWQAEFESYCSHH